jgi:hypothetical protein
MPVRYPLLLLVFPAWLALLFYLPALTHGFVWDDTYFLRDLPYLRDPALWWQALQEPLFVSRNYFRPLPLLTFIVEARLGDSQAFVFHAVNVLLHMANTTLVVLLARNILPADRRGLWVASGMGVLFALHPALVENVSWISDRFDLLMASFILGALWAECRLRNTWRRDLLQSLCLLGALLCKETGVVLLPLLLLWQIFLQMDRGAGWAEMVRSVKVRWRLWCGLLVALMIYLALRHAAFGFLYRGNSSLVAGDLLQHLLLVGKTLGSYVVLLLFPFGQLAPVHPALTPIAVGDVSAWLGLLVIASITVGLVFSAWRRKPLAVLGLMALVALGPVSNLLPLTTGDNIVHDRYLLLTVVFACLALGRALLCTRMHWPAYAASAWGLGAALTVALTVPHWESDNTLWEWAYRKHPDSQIAAENYMTVLVNTQRNEEALALTEKFLHAGNWMQRGSAHYLRAFVFRRQNRLGEAETEIKHALDLPRRDDALGAYLASEKLNALARIQMEQMRYVPAGKNLQESLRLTPHMASSYYWLAVLHYRQGQIAEGDAAMAQACRYAVPNHAEAFRREIAPERQRALRKA